MVQHPWLALLNDCNKDKSNSYWSSFDSQVTCHEHVWGLQSANISPALQKIFQYSIEGEYLALSTDSN